MYPFSRIFNFEVSSEIDQIESSSFERLKQRLADLGDVSERMPGTADDEQTSGQTRLVLKPEMGSDLDAGITRAGIREAHIGLRPNNGRGTCQVSVEMETSLYARLLGPLGAIAGPVAIGLFLLWIPESVRVEGPIVWSMLIVCALSTNLAGVAFYWMTTRNLMRVVRDALE